jgi:hypothetical protein
MGQPINSRLALAVRFWFVNTGCIPSDEVARRFGVFHEHLTLAIQRQIATRSGVEIKDSAPVIDIIGSKEHYEHQQVKYAYAELPYTLELFYYMKYPERIPSEPSNPENDMEFQEKIIFAKFVLQK